MTSSSEPSGPAGGPGAGEIPQLESLESQLRQLRTDYELLDEVVQDFLHPAAGEAPGGADGAGEESFEPRYPSLEEWVTDYFAPMFARPLSPAVRWCAQWWDHAEAISRLEALWRTWEVARLDELRGLATWYRDYLDAQLPVLLGAGGPFAQCTPDRHSPIKPLHTVPAPDGYWQDGYEDDEPDGETLPPDSPYREQEQQ